MDTEETIRSTYSPPSPNGILLSIFAPQMERLQQEGFEVHYRLRPDQLSLARVSLTFRALKVGPHFYCDEGYLASLDDKDQRFTYQLLSRWLRCESHGRLAKNQEMTWDEFQSFVLQAYAEVNAEKARAQLEAELETSIRLINKWKKPGVFQRLCSGLDAAMGMRPLNCKPTYSPRVLALAASLGRTLPPL